MPLKKIPRVILCMMVLSIFIFETHRFSTAKWEAMPEMRKLIISDLLNRYDFIGMHEEDVIALLGPETEGNQQTSFMPQMKRWSTLLVRICWKMYGLSLAYKTGA